MLHKLWISAIKELRVILRDREGLAILFVMPLGFVIIMSMALQDFFHQGSTPQFDLVVLDGDRGQLADAIGNGVAAMSYFQVDHRRSDGYAAAEHLLREEVSRGKVRFALLLPPGSTQRFLAAAPDPRLDPSRLLQSNQTRNVEPNAGMELVFIADPALRSDHLLLARTAIASLLASIDAQRVIATLTGAAFDAASLQDGGRRYTGGLRIAEAQNASAGSRPLPSSTQQNVPAYSLLAIFMLVVPLSGTFIREREQGSLMRLESMPVPAAAVLGGKVLPYLVINLLQMALCLAVGIYLLPLLGGEALEIGHSHAGILVLSVAVSLAAIGFGLLVALFARTTEQATAFGATAILLLAALGGIMVPKMLMPASLQAVAAYSPLGWALDGFHDLFVRNGGLRELMPRVARLLAFAALCFGMALWRYATRAHLR